VAAVIGFLEALLAVCRAAPQMCSRRPSGARK
jgi:hypothetical protein